MKKSLPGGLTIVANVLSVVILSKLFSLSDNVISTMSVILVAITGFILLFKICNQFNKLKIFMFIFLIILFFSCIIRLPKLFEIVILKPIYLISIAILFVLDIGLFNVLYEFCSKKLFKYKDKIIK